MNANWGEFDRSYFDEGVWRLYPFDQVEEGAEEDDDAYYPTPLTAWIEEEFYDRQDCPYCKVSFTICPYISEEEREFSEDTLVNAPDIARLWVCPNCAYWQWYSLLENRGLHGHAATSVLLRFEPLVPEGCWSEFAQHLRRNRELWNSLDPIGMERLVAQLFRANFSHSEVIHVGRPGDRGVDVLFIDSGGSTWRVQVKRCSRSQAVEGFETLQKILGTLVLEGEQNGIIVSNANHFSVQARQQAARVAQRGITIELFDKGVLNRMLGALMPERPWESIFDELSVPLELRDRFTRMVAGQFP